MLPKHVCIANFPLKLQKLAISGVPQLLQRMATLSLAEAKFAHGISTPCQN